MNLQHVIEQFIAYRKSLGERQAANGYNGRGFSGA